MRLSAIVCAAVFLIPLSARADDMPRKVNFLTVLTDEDGKPFQTCIRADEKNAALCAEQKDITLSFLSLKALTIQEPNEDGVEQVRRAVLAQEIYKKGEAALDSKDTDLLCTSIAKLDNRLGLSAMVTLRAWELLDPARIKR